MKVSDVKACCRQPRLQRFVLLGCVRVLACASLFAGFEADAAFVRRDLAVPGEIVAFDWADADGDGLTDLVVAFRRGRGPLASKSVAVFFRNERGYNPEPNLIFPAPATAAIWDLGDVLGGRGADLVVLTGFGVVAQSFDARRASSPTTVARARTLVSTPEEDDLVRWDFVRTFAPEDANTTLLIPTARGLDLFRRDATQTYKRWSSVEIKNQAFYDAESRTFKQGRRGGAQGRPFSLKMTTILPTLTFSDQTGDGHKDLVATFEDRVSVYPARKDGTLSSTATVDRWLRALSREEEAANDTDLSLDIADVNGDRISDLVATKVGGGVTNLKTETRFYLGEVGGGFSAQPVRALKTDGFAGLLQFSDLDGDGLVDMIQPYVTVSIFKLSQVIVTGKFSLDFRVWRGTQGPKSAFEGKARQAIESSLALDLSTSPAGMRGISPVVGADLDRDGVPDLVVSQGAELLEFYRGRRPSTGEANGLMFDEDSAARLVGPVSKETYAVPIRDVDPKSPSDVIAFFTDQPKMLGRIIVWSHDG